MIIMSFCKVFQVAESKRNERNEKVTGDGKLSMTDALISKRSKDTKLLVATSASTMQKLPLG